MQPRRNKFNARKVTIGKLVFDSQKEADRYRVLKAEARRGLIEEFVVKPKYVIEVNGLRITSYTPDFVYRRGGLKVVEDVKGYRTRDYRLKQKLMRAVYGIEVLESGRRQKSRRKNGRPRTAVS